MLRSRIIPCLLMHKKGLVKTINFKNSKYVGDPINAVKIFNEKEVDELMIIDIDATAENYEPDYDLIKKIANESRMPICYGGGVKNSSQATKISKLGVEKIAISSSIFNDFSIINEISESIGKQSVVVVLDVKKNFIGKYEIYTNNGKNKVQHSLDSVLDNLEKIGIGELVINSIDRDGTMLGYDLNLARKVRKKISSPLTVLGGAKNEQDILKLIDEFEIIGAAVGSMFVFKGPYKAVLINYINDKVRLKVIEKANKKEL